MDIQNSEIIQEILEATNIQVGQGNVPTKIGNEIVPVIQVNPKLLRRIDIVRNGSDTDGSTTGTTIYTTPADKDFYLCGMHLAHSQSAASDNTLVIIRITPYGDNSTRNIIEFTMQTATAQSMSVHRDLAIPIKLARNSTIQYVTGTTTAAQADRFGIYGYTVK